MRENKLKWNNVLCKALLLPEARITDFDNGKVQERTEAVFPSGPIKSDPNWEKVPPPPIGPAPVKQETC